MPSGQAPALRHYRPASHALLEEWFERHRRSLFCYFLRHTRQQNDAEDLVQDVFLRLSRRESVLGIRNDEAFLFETASNLLRDWARKRRTHGVVVQPAVAEHELWDREPGPDRVLLAKVELDAVVQALEGLGEKTRRIFVLRRMEQLKCQEIAALYGISVKAVERHIALALVHLAGTISRP
jgi:RNA polymerase sigma factor (sigma-70 family)